MLIRSVACITRSRSRFISSVGSLLPRRFSHIPAPILSSPKPPVPSTSTSTPTSTMSQAPVISDELRARQKAKKEAAKAEKAKKKQAAGGAGSEATATAAADGDDNSSTIAVKVPKGTRDATPEQMTIRDRAFDIIKTIFLRHGAVGIDTPVFELKETLMGKYGEDSKLIYDLADQGGELLSLRYDLTVPFARYLATHGVDKIKRYHIARVYRRDAPAMTKGRFREFYQCDYDIAGVYPSMVPDAEVLKVCTEILDELNLGNYKIKLNHRKILDALMDVCGVPASSFRPICSAIDKLDKEPWDVVKLEMTQQKGLDEKVADELGKYVTKPPGKPFEMLASLRADSKFASHEGAKQAFTELESLFNYLTAMKGLDRISFDLSLARGLDYYTGVIYEAVLTDTDRVGSIAAGGRYDSLVGMFSSTPVPAVGISIGIERIFNILEELEQKRGIIRKNQTQILVASIGKNMLEHRMKLASDLWSAGIATEFLYDAAPKPQKQLDYVLSNHIPFSMWIGEDEIQQGIVTVKETSKGKDQTARVIPRDQIITQMKDLLKGYVYVPAANPREESKESK